MNSLSWNDGFRVWLNEGKSLENAQMIVNHFMHSQSDWSKESLCALIGNMRHESSLNPNMYEYGYDWSANRGYGLVQWTPRSKFWDWAVSAGKNPEKAESQLDRIDYEIVNNIQYIANGHQKRYGKGDKYDFSFATFRSNSVKLNVNQLTEAFMWNYEGPNYNAGNGSLKDRTAFAHRAYNELDWENVEQLPPTPTDPEQEPQPKTEYDFEIFVDLLGKLNKVMTEKLQELLTINMFNYSGDNTFGNSFLTIDKQLDNMYRIRPTVNFDDIIKGIFDDALNGLGDVIDNIKPIIPPPDVDPNPDPTPPVNNRVFPVDYTASGINFWYPPYKDNLTRNMDWGQRTTGQWHAGYDVGGGGKTHKIYAVEDGVVTQSRYANITGYLIAIKHDNDEYYSCYQHLQSNLQFKVGDKVKAGDFIANMGATGGNYAIHLHYILSKTQEFWTKGKTIDPKKYLGITGNNKTTLPNPVKKMVVN